ncbi:hypothetical protein EOD23_16815 [Mesorhizobium sp. USDA-HM6]|nr:hypothetical protein EOD23_16815 [Mesorhizobium sp. USDA-HM6]
MQVESSRSIVKGRHRQAAQSLSFLDRCQVANFSAGELLLEQQMPKSPILHADKGYDTNAIRHNVEGNKTRPNIPPKANQRWKNGCSPFLYRDRNTIERMFGRLKRLPPHSHPVRSISDELPWAVCRAATPGGHESERSQKSSISFVLTWRCQVGSIRPSARSACRRP